MVELPRNSTSWAGKRVTVMGLGRFGGNWGAIRYLALHGAHVTVSEQAPADDFQSSIAQLADLSQVRVHFGGHREEDFANADCVVASPAVKPSHPLLHSCRQRGVPVTTELALLWSQQPGRIIAVTGSNGKSTTAALIAHLLRSAGRHVFLGGNIGGSLLGKLDQMTPKSWLVLEVSSFQLTYLAGCQANADVAVVTNLTPNHLDWHGDFAAYRQAKQSLLARQLPSQIAVLNADDADVSTWPTPARKLWFGTQDHEQPGLFCQNSRPLRSEGGIACNWRTGKQVLSFRLPADMPGASPHLLNNHLAAAAVALSCGLRWETVLHGFASFSPLPHRLQWIADVDGVRWINDSASTTPESTIVGIRSSPRPLTLIVGGASKQIDLRPLARAIEQHCSAVVTMGQTGDEIADHVEASAGKCRVVRAGTLAAAIRKSQAEASRGGCVLFSPGCASFDQFRDYQERGNQFAAAVQQMVVSLESPSAADTNSNP